MSKCTSWVGLGNSGWLVGWLVGCYLVLSGSFGLIDGGLASSMCVGVFQLVSSGPRLCVCQHDLCFCCLSDCLMVFQ